MTTENANFNKSKSGRVWRDESEQLGNLFQFLKHGDEIEGEVTKIEKNVKMRNGETSRYTLRTEEGASFIVIGTAIINQKMGEAEVGDVARPEVDL